MSQREFDSFDGLRRWLARNVAAGDAVVGIEGHSTAGKTWLAKQLASTFRGAVHIATDSYAGQLDEQTESYLELLDLGPLFGAVSQAKESGALVVIEGICLRNTCRALGIGPDVFVYVKRISQAGLWPDAPTNLLTNGQPAPWLSWVDQQSAEYHQRVSPDRMADAIYKRSEEIDSDLESGTGGR